MNELTETSLALINFREKRKWQIALRRYVLGKHNSAYYAPYFGLDIENYRKWLELQFDDSTNWNNFGKAWQLDHIIPVGYFDFSSESDLKLCWNFINVRVEKSSLNKNRGNRVDVLTAKGFFEELFKATSLPIILQMIKKIEQLEISQIKSTNKLEAFILENRQYLEDVQSLSQYEFEQLNMGLSMKEIQIQRSLVLKFGR
jgi:hypothetical protein